MASELKVNKLTGVTTAGSILVTGEGNSTTTNLQQGLAKHWVKLDGSGTVSLLDSLNASGLTDNGNGAYTPALTNNMNNANYCLQLTSSVDTGTDFFFASFGDGGSGYDLPTTSTYKTLNCGSGGSTADTDGVCCEIKGDLA